jgi:hypothetical protein
VITSPVNGAAINRPDIMVRGTVNNQRGNETGVTVNGRVAMVFGNQFAVNHLPLEKGSSNAIEAVATDTEGNTATTSIIVKTVAAQEFINLSASTESGISPLEATLTIESSLDLTNASLTYTGPGEIEFLSQTAGEYKVKLTAEGIYHFTVSIDSGNTSYQDSVALVVLSEMELDALLRAKWESMKSALVNRNVEKATSLFAEHSKVMYRYNFELMKDLLPSIVQSMGDIEIVAMQDRVAKYEMVVIEDGEETLFYVEFIRDIDGLWKISFF